MKPGSSFVAEALSHTSLSGRSTKKLTSKLGKVIVTCSPLPTSSSPSHAVSMDAGLKSSVAKKRAIKSSI